MELPPHVGGLRGHGKLWDPTEPLFPHQGLQSPPPPGGPTQCLQPAFLLLLQHHMKAAAETLVTFRSQPAARLGLPGFSPTGEGVPAQRPCGDMSLSCRSLREARWALRVSPVWAKVLYAHTPNNQSPHNNHWVLVPWFPKGHLPEAPIRCLGMAHLSLAHIWEMCVSRGAC